VRQAKRVVVKVGSALLTTRQRAIDGRMLLSLVSQIATQRDAGLEVLLVTSGAVALGLGPLGFSERPTELAALQACAATGQVRLMHHYAEAFGTCGIAVAQVLLTHADLADRRRYLNARRAVGVMLGRRVLPIFNENDTVAADEIKLGDNDTLAAEVVGLVDADGLLLLTDIDGLYDANPHTHKDAQRLSFVPEITDEIRAVAGGTTGVGTGGMMTKVRAASVAASHGAWTVIAPGRQANVIHTVLEGEDVGTLVPAAEERRPARKRWIARTLRSKGVVVVDAGAARALRTGSGSLLPAGICQVEGAFESGDAVEVRTETGELLGRGLTSYDSDEVKRIAGKKTGEIAGILGYKYADEIIHRDDLVVD
jgi:glutamate 5-kinase